MQFLPFLTDDQGRSLTVENEVVVTRSIPDPLENSPEGWEANALQYTRNNEFRAMIKAYTTNLKFYLSGAKILRDAFYRKGMETVLFFIWLKLDQSFGGGLKHKPWYKGEPDFGTFRDLYDGVEINITEGGFYKDLQANKNVVQEIPFDEDAKSLYLDGMIFYNTLHYQLAAVEEEFNGNGDLIGFANNFTIPFLLISQEGATAGITFLSVNREQLGVVADYMNTSNNWIAKNEGAVAVTFPIAGKIEIKATVADTVLCQIYFRTSGGTNYQVIPDTPISAGVLYSFPFSFDITLAPGEKLFGFRQLVGKRFIGGYQETSVFDITTVTRPQPTVILAHTIYNLGNKLTGRVSPGAVLNSPFLQADVNLLVASGDSIRSIPNPVIKTSFSEWHRSVDAVKCIALEVVDNNPSVTSRYDKFNKNSTIAELGECSAWTLEPADDYIYDSVEVGYPSKSSDSNIDVNGKYSFNNTFIWKLNVTRRKPNPYLAKSVYYADPYDIELIRLNFGGKTTTAGSTDNSNFFIDAEPKTDISFTGTIHYYATDNRIELTGDVAAITPFIIVGGKISIDGQVWTVKSIVDIDTLDIIFVANELIAVSSDTFATATVTNLYQLRRLPYATVTGIPDDGTIFNLELSPRRIIERHFPWLRSSFDHLDYAKLVLQTTEKNKDLVTIDASGNVISEKADILVSSMGEKVYLPYFVSFEIKSPYNLRELMEANSGGKFNYSMNGVDMDGFPDDISTQDAHLETQEYRLLMTANNDNERLINNR